MGSVCVKPDENPAPAYKPTIAKVETAADEPSRDAGLPMSAQIDDVKVEAKKEEPPAPVPEVVKDLKQESVKGKDIYERFELTMPFNRTHCTQFWNWMVECKKEDGNEDFITLGSIRKWFQSDAW